MRLILATISSGDSPTVPSVLTKEGYQVTRLATTGGSLRTGNTILIVGTDDDKIECATETTGEYGGRHTEVVSSTALCDTGGYVPFPAEIQIGGVVTFVIDVEKFIKL